MPSSRSFLTGMILALPLGFVTGIMVAFLVTPEHVAKARQLVTRRALGHEPQVDFEALEQ
jgi:hypothetical protein